MKFKIDENLPVEVADLLRRAGHDVLTVHDESLAGASDQDLAAVCKSEERAIVTLDVHFADIRNYPPAEFAGIVVLRLSHQDKPHVIKVLEKIVALFTPEAIRGKLWIVDEDKIRVRE